MKTDIELAYKLASIVQEHGGRTYYVGGLVRDEQMGIDNKDVDVEVFGIEVDELKEIISSIGTLIEKGMSFPVFGIKGSDIDIALPRTERKTGALHTDFEVSVDSNLSTEKASVRRDFTCNSLYCDVLSGEIIDHWDGLGDIKRRELRHVNTDTFIEDPLRVFRAAQFASRFEFNIAPDTLALCRKIDVSMLSSERIFEETKKALLKSHQPSTYFRILKQMGHLGEFFPELANLIGVNQRPEFHPEGDAFEHTMMVVDAAANLKNQAEYPLSFMFSALCHDLGKAHTTTRNEKGIITSIGHEKIGAEIAVKMMRRITSERKLLNYVKNQTELHMLPHSLARASSKIKKSNLLFDAAVSPNDLMLLAVSDTLGRGIEKTPEFLDFVHKEAAYLEGRISVYKEMSEIQIYTGKRLIQDGIVPGPRFKEIIDRAWYLQLCGLNERQIYQQLKADGFF